MEMLRLTTAMHHINFVCEMVGRYLGICKWHIHNVNEKCIPKYTSLRRINEEENGGVFGWKKK